MSEDALPEPDRVEGAPHPREVADLFGQTRAETDFLDSFNGGRLHHAWLITGPKGIGKATLAWRIARFLLSGAEGGMFAPETLAIPTDSPIYRRTAALSEPGLALVRRPWDEKAKRLKTAITVDEIRSLKSFFTLSNTEGGWRVAIIDAADEMNRAAENALLKLLEEPPAKTVILLVAHQPSRLLPTIRSRCRELKCQPLDADALARAIAQAGFDTDDPDTLATLANGSAGEAIDLLAHDGLKLYADITSLIATAPRMNRPRIIALGDSCAGATNADRYDMVVRLTLLALSRMALAGARGSTPIGAEADLSRFANNPFQAQLWAELVADQSARIAHARAVNLDPGQVILDTFLAIDATAGKASLVTS